MKLPGILAALAFSVGTLSAQQAQSTEQVPTTELTSKERAVVLDPFTVSASQGGGYGTADTSGGSRVALPILDVPMSIVVINQALMQDLGASSYISSLQWVSGMNVASDPGIGAMDIRGIEVRGNSFSVLDGLPWGLGDSGPLETAFVDRYEVVKGPAGTLYGDFSVGGLVNRIYKAPLSTQQSSINFDYSSFGKATEIIDSTGPIDKAGQFLYRVIGVEAEGHGQYYDDEDRQGLYATFQYVPKGSNTKFWVRGQYSHINFDEGDAGANAIVDETGATSLNYFSARECVQPLSVEDVYYHYFEFGVTTTTTGMLGTWSSRFVVLRGF